MISMRSPVCVWNRRRRCSSGVDTVADAVGALRENRPAMERSKANNLELIVVYLIYELQASKTAGSLIRVLRFCSQGNSSRTPRARSSLTNQSERAANRHPSSATHRTNLCQGNLRAIEDRCPPATCQEQLQLAKGAIQRNKTGTSKPRCREQTVADAGLRVDHSKLSGRISAGSGREKELVRISVVGRPSAELEAPQSRDADYITVFILNLADELARRGAEAMDGAVIHVANQQSVAEGVEVLGRERQAPRPFQYGSWGNQRFQKSPRRAEHIDSARGRSAECHHNEALDKGHAIHRESG